MLPSIQLPLAITSVAALVTAATRESRETPAVVPADANEPQRRVMFAAGVIRKRRGEKLRWS